jgi:hypothetical protein
MEQAETWVAGVDIIDNRYFLCLLDKDGKHPRYYRGRVDTAGAQQKLYRYLGSSYTLVIVDSPLALGALSILGKARVVIKDADEHYGAWERAGIKRGNSMARFVALLYREQLIGPKPLTPAQERAFLLEEAKKMEQMLNRFDQATALTQDILGGNPPSKAYEKALALMDDHPPAQDKGNDSVQPEPEAEDRSLFALLLRALKK